MLHNEPFNYQNRIAHKPLSYHHVEHVISYQQMDLAMTITEDNATNNFNQFKHSQYLG